MDLFEEIRKRIANTFSNFGRMSPSEMLWANDAALLFERIKELETIFAISADDDPIAMLKFTIKELKGQTDALFEERVRMYIDQDRIQARAVEMWDVGVKLAGEAMEGKKLRKKRRRHENLDREQCHVPGHGSVRV